MHSPLRLFIRRPRCLKTKDLVIVTNWSSFVQLLCLAEWVILRLSHIVLKRCFDQPGLIDHPCNLTNVNDTKVNSEAISFLWYR